jgi:hypothetical protein
LSFLKHDGHSFVLLMSAEQHRKIKQASQYTSQSMSAFTREAVYALLDVGVDCFESIGGAQ